MQRRMRHFGQAEVEAEGCAHVGRITLGPLQGGAPSREPAVPYRLLAHVASPCVNVVSECAAGPQHVPAELSDPRVPIHCQAPASIALQVRRYNRAPLSGPAREAT